MAEPRSSTEPNTPRTILSRSQNPFLDINSARNETRFYGLHSVPRNSPTPSLDEFRDFNSDIDWPFKNRFRMPSMLSRSTYMNPALQVQMAFRNPRTGSFITHRECKLSIYIFRYLSVTLRKNSQTQHPAIPNCAIRIQQNVRNFLEQKGVLAEVIELRRNTWYVRAAGGYHIPPGELLDCRGLLLALAYERGRFNPSLTAEEVEGWLKEAKLAFTVFCKGESDLVRR